MLGKKGFRKSLSAVLSQSTYFVLGGVAFAEGMTYYRMNQIPNKNHRRAWLLSRNYKSNLWDNECLMMTGTGALLGVLSKSGLLYGAHLGGMCALSFYLVNDIILEKYGLNLSTHYFVM